MGVNFRYIRHLNMVRQERWADRTKTPMSDLLGMWTDEIWEARRYGYCGA